MTPVATYGYYAVYPPYESHDGPVGWTVQRVVSGSDDLDDMGHLLAEFQERADAELFAQAKAERDPRAPSRAGRRAQ